MNKDDLFVVKNENLNIFVSEKQKTEGGGKPSITAFFLIIKNSIV